MKQFILREGVLNDDTLYLPDTDMLFKGNYIAILKRYTYQNEWSNSLQVKKFRSESSLEKYLEKNYPEFELQIEI